MMEWKESVFDEASRRGWIAEIWISRRVVRKPKQLHSNVLICSFLLTMTQAWTVVRRFSKILGREVGARSASWKS